MLLSDIWIPDLVQTGPPDWASRDRVLIEHVYSVPNLAELRSIKSNPIHERALVLLRGMNDEFDGLLQGWYWYQPIVDHDDDGGDFIVADDGKSMWRKIPEISSGGSGGGGTIIGSGSPEGNEVANPGRYYWDATNKAQWIKETGTGSTGWWQQIG